MAPQPWNEDDHFEMPTAVPVRLEYT